MKRLLVFSSILLIFFSTLAKANESGTITYVDLMRFAWQQHYAPKKFQMTIPNIKRVPLHAEFFVANLDKKHHLFIHPMRQWQSQDNYLTTLLVRNKYSHSIKIDISRDFCGPWKAGVIYPRSELKPYGNKETDSTLVFLISKQPFETIMRHCHGHA